MKIYGDYFYGNKISDYGLKHKRVDYATFAKAFDAVLANGIMNATADIGYWEPCGSSEMYYEDAAGNIYDYDGREERLEQIREQIDALEDLEELNDAEREQLEDLENDAAALENEYYYDVYQWYIIDERGAEICREAGEIVYYNDALDLYLWGVTHYGTSWGYVLTSIECRAGLEGIDK